MELIAEIFLPIHFSDLPVAPPPYNGGGNFSKEVKSNTSPEMDQDAQLRERLANLRQMESNGEFLIFSHDKIMNNGRPASS